MGLIKTEGWEGQVTIGEDVWAEIVSVELEQAMSESDVTTRADAGQEVIQPGRQATTLTISIQDDDDDTIQTAVEGAFQARTPVVVEALNHADGKGVSGDFVVTRYRRSEPADGPETIELTLRPAGAVEWTGAGS